MKMNHQSSTTTPTTNLAPMRPGTRWVPKRVARLLVERYGLEEALVCARRRFDLYRREVEGVGFATHDGRWLYWHTVVRDVARYPQPSQLEALMVAFLEEQREEPRALEAVA